MLSIIFHQGSLTPSVRQDVIDHLNTLPKVYIGLYSSSKVSFEVISMTYDNLENKTLVYIYSVLPANENLTT